jgi:hypothetical protein
MQSSMRKQLTAKENDLNPRDRLNWIDAVALDLRVSAEAFRLAHVIQSRFINSKTGEAWPSQETIADLLGIKERQVRNLISELVALNWIDKRRGGNGQPNRYRLTGNTGAGQDDRLTGSGIAGQVVEQTGNEKTADRQCDDLQTGSGIAAYLAYTSTKNPEGAPSAPPSSSTINVDSRSTVDVVGQGETRADRASPSHDEDRCVYVGKKVEHRKLGSVVVEKIFPAQRTVRVRVSASGQVRNMTISDGIEFVEPPSDLQEARDEIPF